MNWRCFFVAIFFFKIWVIAQQESPLINPVPSNISQKGDSSKNNESIDIPLFNDDEQQLNGVLAARDFNIRLPEHIGFGESSELLLSYRPSPLLLPDLSTMTVLINGTKLHSVAIGNTEIRSQQIKPTASSVPNHLTALTLTPSKADRSKKPFLLRIPLSSKNLRIGWNKISIQCLMQTTRTPCRDVDNPATWLIVEGDSLLRISYHRLKMVSELHRFPQSIAEERLLQPSAPSAADSKLLAPIALLFPTKIQEAHLRTLAIVSARLAQLNYLTENDYCLKDLSSLATESKIRNGIIIATRDELAEVSLPDEITSQIAKLSAGQGLVAEFIKNGNHIQQRWIVATGADEIGLEKAGLTLGNTYALENTPSNPSIINSFPIIPPWIEEMSQPISSKTTFQSLGFEQLTFRGAFRSEKSIPLRFPPGFKLTAGSRFHLDFNHSGSLKETSAIELVLNGNPVGNIALTSQNATISSADFVLPSSIAGADPMLLTFHAYLDIGTVDCAHRYEERAWATLFGTSFLDAYARPLEISGLDRLELFLLKDTFLRRTTFLIPEKFTQPDIEMVCSLMWKLGRGLPSSPVLWPDICLYGPNRLPPLKKLEGHSVLLLGSAAQWKMGLPNEIKLPISISDSDKNVVSMRGQNIAISKFEPTLAFAQMLPSPWSKKDILVIAGGWDSFSIPSVKKMLTDPKILGRLAETVCAVDAKGRVMNYDFRIRQLDSLADRVLIYLPVDPNVVKSIELIELEKTWLTAKNVLLTCFVILLLTVGVWFQVVLLRERTRKRKEKEDPWE